MLHATAHAPCTAQVLALTPPPVDEAKWDAFLGQVADGTDTTTSSRDNAMVRVLIAASYLCSASQ